jgi:hypothetical protein
MHAEDGEEPPYEKAWPARPWINPDSRLGVELEAKIDLMSERHALLLMARRSRKRADQLRIDAQHYEDDEAAHMRRVREIERYLAEGGK